MNQQLGVVDTDTKHRLKDATHEPNLQSRLFPLRMVPPASRNEQAGNSMVFFLFFLFFFPPYDRYICYVCYDVYEKKFQALKEVEIEIENVCLP